MAPKKRLGVGAEGTLSLHFLHRRDKIAEKIPNQTKSQKLSVLVVQERMENPIRRKAMQCVVFRHEDFGGQLLWCMENYVKVDVEGPKETFVEALHVEATQGQEQATQSNNNGGGSGGGQEEAIELHQAILDVIQNPHLNVDDIRAAGNVAWWLTTTTCQQWRTPLNKTLTTTTTTTISCQLGSIVGFANVIQPSERMQPLC